MVKALNINSVGGPDGFNTNFYLKCWDIIKDDLCEAIWDFWDGTQCPPQILDTLIILIVKTQHPKKWDDFRPISLSNVICRILSKLIYGNVQTVLPNCISPEQGAFVEGRNIIDNIIVA